MFGFLSSVFLYNTTELNSVTKNVFLERLAAKNECLWQFMLQNEEGHSSAKGLKER